MIELLTTAEMAEADRRTIAGGVAGIELMENAGRSIADAVTARHPPGLGVAVVAGPGNNGGDGFVAARFLAERGYRVRVLISYGTAWFPWYMRRLAERPANVWFVARSLFTR